MDILANDYEKYTDAAIYALVGSDGKRYIGQAKNYYQRMQQHRYAFNSIAKGKHGAEGYKLCEAIKNGITFRAEILEKIPLIERTYNNLNRRELYYYRLYGGLDGTYNSTEPKPPYHSLPDGDMIIFTFKVSDPNMRKKLESVGDYNEYVKELIKKDIRENGQRH